MPQSMVIKRVTTTAGKFATNRKKAPRLQTNRNARRINKWRRFALVILPPGADQGPSLDDYRAATKGSGVTYPRARVRAAFCAARLRLAAPRFRALARA